MNQIVERIRRCVSVTKVNGKGEYDLNGKGRARCDHDHASHAHNVLNLSTGKLEEGCCLVSGCECRGFLSEEDWKEWNK